MMPEPTIAAVLSLMPRRAEWREGSRSSPGPAVCRARFRIQQHPPIGPDEQREDLAHDILFQPQRDLINQRYGDRS